MIPTNTGSTSPCSNISSNCVVWQGPDIPCINLCNGDTISDVVAKLAEELCALLNVTAVEPNLSGLDLLCVLPDGQATPSTLEEILQLIINSICGITDKTDFVLPIIDLPSCLMYDDKEGFAVTALPLDEYAALLANQICDILASILIIQTTISNHESRLIILENCVLPCAANEVNEIQVLPSCVLPQNIVNASVLLLALESSFCNLQSLVGSPALISTAINAQCIFGNDVLVGGTGTYSSIPGWVTNVNTLAESNKNLWLVVCDMYQAIQDIKLNCCPGGCDAIIYAFTPTLILNALNIPTSMNLVFTGSSIPASFNNCTTSSMIDIADMNGTHNTASFNPASLQSSPSGITIPLTSLFLYGGFTVKVDFCTTDGANQCGETIIQTVPSDIPCPTNVALVSPTENSLTVTFTNNLGTSAIYTIELINVSSGIHEATYTLTNPSANVSQLISGLTANTEYQAYLIVTIGGVTKICRELGSTAFTGTLILSPCTEYTAGTTSGTGQVVNYIDCGGVEASFTIGGVGGFDSDTFCATSLGSYDASAVSIAINGDCPLA